MAKLKDYLTTGKDIVSGKVSIKDAYERGRYTTGGVLRTGLENVNMNEGALSYGKVKKQKTGLPKDYLYSKSHKSSSSKKSSGSSDRNGLSSKEYKAKYGKSYDDGGQSQALKKQKSAEKDRMRKMKKAYDKLYGTLRDNLLEQRGDVEGQHNTAISGLDMNYNNAMERADAGREETTRFYDESEEDLRSSYEDQRKERERIFTARNITNSSYYIDAVTDADKEFNKVLGRLNEDEAKTYAEQDRQIKELSQERMSKRGEIDSAFAQAMRQIENNLAQTDFQKATAMQNLQDEYNSKMATIEQQLSQIEMAQAQFRERVSSYSVNTGYQANQYNYDSGNDKLKRQSMSPEELTRQALMAGKNGANKDDKENRLMSQDRQQGANMSYANPWPQWSQPKQPQQIIPTKKRSIGNF